MLATQESTVQAAFVGMDAVQYAQMHRKRKAEAAPENNERLSKRLSLLNLEQNGPKLYVPVENPCSALSTTPSFATSLLPCGSVADASFFPSVNSNPLAASRPPPNTTGIPDDDAMQLDDCKHKVYIYNLDDELSSEEDKVDRDGRGSLVFLPDIEKHLRKNRIPDYVLYQSPSNKHEDVTGQELVLYGVPSSLSVPEELDSVRKAIAEARARAREKQRAESEVANTVDAHPMLDYHEQAVVGRLAAPEAVALFPLPGSAELVHEVESDAMDLD